MNLTSQPLVSIVTPVYNGEKYLAECIKSVLAQAYENWEYVIVNNCSTDNTIEIAQYYAQKDARIRIHCKMLQADDLLFPECIMQMVKLAEANPSVGVVGSYWIHGDRVSDGLPYPTTVISGREIGRLCLFGKEEIFGTPTTTLIRSALIRSRKAFYNESNIGSDKETIYDVLQSSDFGFVQQILTYYRHHNEQSKRDSYAGIIFLLGKIFTLKRCGETYLNSEEYEKFLEKQWKYYYRFLARNIFSLRKKQFRNDNKKSLKALGEVFSLTKLLEVIYLRILNALLNPYDTVKKVVVLVSKKKML